MSIPRPAQTKDAAAISRLVDAAYQHYVVMIGRKPKPMTVDYSRAIEQHQVWVVDFEDTLTGVLELIPQNSSLLIENIAVPTAFQRKGLGRSLMQFAETQALKQGLTNIRLYTNEHFTENLVFYTHLGYVETHREHFKGSDVVYMSKNLKPFS